MITSRRELLSIALGGARRWVRDLWQCLLPATCLLCGDRGANGRPLCPGCLADLPRAGAACTVCAEPLPVQAICGRCQQSLRPYDRALALFRYAWPVDHMITDFKFRGKLAFGNVLGNLMAERFASQESPRPERLVPVPLHPRRLRERGYNQAIELARPIARRLGIPLDLDTCRRIRPTAAQSLVAAAERARNVRGAFAVEGPVCTHVAIVDDVMTTGHTVEALAKALRRHGAEQVEVWVCARAAGRAL
jgi:ComF family protein